MSVRRRGNKWGLYAYIGGEVHYLGMFGTREEALSYQKLVYSRYPNRITRRTAGTGTIAVSRNKYQVRTASPERRHLGTFNTRLEAEQALESGRCQ